MFSASRSIKGSSEPGNVIRNVFDRFWLIGFHRFRLMFLTGLIHPRSDETTYPCCIDSRIFIVSDFKKHIVMRQSGSVSIAWISFMKSEVHQPRFQDFTFFRQSNSPGRQQN